jgi:uncharacterized protein YvpB
MTSFFRKVLVPGLSLSLVTLLAPALQAQASVPRIHYERQIYTEDCETAALQMALAHEGIQVSQDELLRAEGLSLKGPALDQAGRVVQWGNPNTSFVGLPNSASISTRYTAQSGYGTYAPNIARVARQFGGKVLWSGTGLSPPKLKAFLSEGHPVVAWVGDRAGKMRWAPLESWQAWDGETVEYPAPSSGVYEHCVLVAGWNEAGVLVEDPLGGARNGSNVNPTVGPGWVSWKEFLAGFETFHGMAVVLD